MANDRTVGENAARFEAASREYFTTTYALARLLAADKARFGYGQTDRISYFIHTRINQSGNVMDHHQWASCSSSQCRR